MLSKQDKKQDILNRLGPLTYARDSTFLSVEADNSFRFLLKPFLEYFVAARIMRDINNFDEKQNFQNITLQLNPEIFRLVKSISEADWLVKPQISNYYSSDKTNSELNSKLDKSSNLFIMIQRGKNTSPKTNVGNIMTILNMTGNLHGGIDL
jgi:hypothetical protein